MSRQFDGMTAFVIGSGTAANVRGVFLSIKQSLLEMQTQELGVIVSIASGAGLSGVLGYAASAIFKWATSVWPRAPLGDRYTAKLFQLTHQSEGLLS